MTNHLFSKLPDWFTENHASAFAVPELIGAKTVSRWREEYLKDFAKRIARCAVPL